MTSIRAAREPKSGASGSLCDNVLWMARVGTKIQLDRLELDEDTNTRTPGAYIPACAHYSIATLCLQSSNKLVHVWATVVSTLLGCSPCHSALP